MYDDNTLKLKTITRRAFILGLSKIAVLLVLVGRLFHLQIIKLDQFIAMSENNRIKNRSLKMFALTFLRSTTYLSDFS